MPVPVPKTEGNRGKRPASMNEVCDECSKKPAILFCICSVPPKKFCENCDNSHYQKAPSMVHLKHPISAFKAVNTGEVSIEDFTRRQMYVNELQLKISENLANVDRFISKTQSEFDIVIQACVEQKKNVLIELQALRQQLAKKLNEAAQVIEHKRYLTDYEVFNWLDHLVLRGYITTPSPKIKLFSSCLNTQSMLTAISQSTAYSEQAELLTKNFGRLPVIKGNKVWICSLETLEMKEIVLLQNTNINEATAYSFISDTAVLCCGGNTHSDVYEVDFSTSAVRKANNMTCNRAYAGIFNNKNEYVIVFGGYDGTKCLDTAEKYSFGTNAWSLTEGKMEKAKQACTACEHFTGIYLVGIENNELTVELFNVNTEQFWLIYTGASNSYRPLAVIAEDQLDIILYYNGYQTSLGSAEFTFKTISCQSEGAIHYWSNCQPVEFKGQFFSILTSEAYILKTVPRKNETPQVNRVKSFQY